MGWGGLKGRNRQYMWHDRRGRNTCSTTNRFSTLGGNEQFPVCCGHTSGVGAEVGVERFPSEPNVVFLAAVRLVPEQDVLQLRLCT